MTSASSVYEARQSKPALWDNPEGGFGRAVGGGSGRGTREHPWVTHVEEWQKPPQYCKVISL